MFDTQQIQAEVTEQDTPDDCPSVSGVNDSMADFTRSAGTVHTSDPVQGTRKAIELFKQGLCPFQPLIAAFPVDKNKKRFQKRWYDQFNWLEYSSQLTSAFCFCCRAFGQIGQYDDAFVVSRIGKKPWKGFGLMKSLLLINQVFKNGVKDKKR